MDVIKGEEHHSPNLHELREPVRGFEKEGLELIETIQTPTEYKNPELSLDEAKEHKHQEEFFNDSSLKDTSASTELSNQLPAHCNNQNNIDAFNQKMSSQLEANKSQTSIFYRTLCSGTILVGLFSLSLLLFFTLKPFCNEVEVVCPDPQFTFTTKSCCSVLWWSLGASLGVGNECSINLDDMRFQCPMYSCYISKSGLLNSNGCSYVPEMLLNQNSCDIHDLCYITPGTSKIACDDAFIENIDRIYCQNVDLVERLACRSRANIAGAVVKGIAGFWLDSGPVRDSCTLQNNHLLTYLLAAALGILLSTLLFKYIRKHEKCS